MEDQELRKMVLETHQMVSKLYKFEKNRRFWRALKFILIIVIIVGAYFAILPVFNRVLETYNSFSNEVNDLQKLELPW
jgi:Ni,Fe-hydrogenase I cytochrome b subunit